MIRITVIISYSVIALLCATVSQGASPTIQMVDICTLCRCLDAKTSNEMIVDCHGEDQQAAAGGQHAKYFNLQNIIWPVPKDPLNNPLRIRAFFRNMKLPTLPR